MQAVRALFGRQEGGLDRRAQLEQVFANNRYVNLANREISDEECERIRVIISQQHRGVQSIAMSIKLHGNQIGHVGVTHISESLRTNNMIKSLHLSGNNIGFEGAIAICATLQYNRTLRQLSLDNCNIGSRGCEAIATGLSSNQTMKGLAISRNDIDDVGAVALGSACRNNESLIWLLLDHNRIGHNGCIAMADGLQTNCSLRVLHLMENDVGSVGAGALIESMNQGNESLLYINLSQNGVDDDSLSQISLRLRLNQNKQKIRYHILRRDQEPHPGLWPYLLSSNANHYSVMGRSTIYFLLQSKPELVKKSFYMEVMERKMRRLLRDYDSTSSLWAHALAKLSTLFQGPSLLFSLLKEDPAIFGLQRTT